MTDLTERLRSVLRGAIKGLIFVLLVLIILGLLT
jgi:hypothetical protein